MLITAILIKLDSIGPVFYSQQRVGKDGKIFTLFKFRSMRADAEPEGCCLGREKMTIGYFYWQGYKVSAN